MADPTTDDLKPCPRCISGDVEIETGLAEGCEIFSPRCCACGLECADSFYGRQAAVDWWNTRAILASQPSAEADDDLPCIPGPPPRTIGKVYSPEAISTLEQAAYRKGIEDAAAVARRHKESSKRDCRMLHAQAAEHIEEAIFALGSGGRS